MPHSANVDAEEFEIEREKKRVADGENAYHARDKQLTCSDQQTDATSTTVHPRVVGSWGRGLQSASA
jgi:hypothetical protein